MRDLYTQPEGSEVDPPVTVVGRLRQLGPSLIVSASIVGSGEIILTASLGAAAGFGMLWWVLLSCWSKSIVQAELARYVVVTGDTYIRMLNRMPGKVRLPQGPVSWTLLVALLAFLPGLTGLGGLMGGAAQALVLFVPSMSPVLVTAGLAVVIAVVLATGRYRNLERTLIPMVLVFTVSTLICFVMLQNSSQGISLDQTLSGLQFEFDLSVAVLALAVYGYTGVNSAEISAYSYWCIEKGYPGKVGPSNETEEYTVRARGWLNVLQVDVIATLLLLTLATVPFYYLGAGILHPLGTVPAGSETIRVLSQMFTEILGEGAFLLFATGAFCILFSSAIAGVAAGARYIPDYLMELGLLGRDRVDVRRRVIKVYGLIMPFVGVILYAGFQNPVLMVTIAACFGALMLPIQSGMTLYLSRRLPLLLRASPAARRLLQLTFLFQMLMAAMVIYFVAL
jgi:Mn2+/Fe2+ NRAMP family transporter